MYGCPTFFITFDPTNIYHILVHILFGKDPFTFVHLTSFDHTKQVVDNPATAATFFDIMMKAFIFIYLESYLLSYQGTRNLC